MSGSGAELHGCTALITGATSGIGRAVAINLAQRGAEICAIGRRADLLQDLVTEIREHGGQASGHAVDVGAVDAVQRIEAVIEPLGRLDILVNNAGTMILDLVRDASESDYNDMIDVNLRGLMSVTRAALAALEATATVSPRGIADIVNISSLSARDPLAGRAAYAATKAGVNAFAEALRREQAEKGVRVTVVEPGLVTTELRSRSNPATVATLQTGYDAANALRPEHIADAVTYAVTRPAEMSVSTIVVRPAGQLG